MSKTFNSAITGRVLEVENFQDDVFGINIGETKLVISNTDAPALCLAILEAAGVEPLFDADADFGTAEQLGHIQDHLHEYVKAQEDTAAADADRVKLEAEALKLYNAGRKHQCMVNDATWDDLNNTTQKYWLAVARAARELNKEAGQ